MRWQLLKKKLGPKNKVYFQHGVFHPVLNRSEDARSFDFVNEAIYVRNISTHLLLQLHAKALYSMTNYGQREQVYQVLLGRTLGQRHLVHAGLSYFSESEYDPNPDGSGRSLGGWFADSYPQVGIGWQSTITPHLSFFFLARTWIYPEDSQLVSSGNQSLNLGIRIH
ncbi:MAG: hypothetical protein AAFY71_24205 [Bacteroidota bacterium]